MSSSLAAALAVSIVRPLLEPWRLAHVPWWQAHVRVRLLALLLLPPPLPTGLY